MSTWNYLEVIEDPGENSEGKAQVRKRNYHKNVLDDTRSFKISPTKIVQIYESIYKEQNKMLGRTQTFNRNISKRHFRNEVRPQKH